MTPEEEREFRQIASADTWVETDQADYGIMLAEIDRLREPQWQPIESAPKDMVEIVIFAPDEKPRVFTAKWIHGWSRSVSGEYKSLDDFFGDNDIRATHWMPLPEPPK